MKARPEKTLLAIFTVIGLFSVLLSFAMVDPVFGQSGTTLSVIPASATLYLNNVNTIELDLVVTNAVSLQGFDLTLTYDPAVVHLDSWAHGGMLASTAVVYKTDIPGLFRLAVVQLGGTPPSGDGTLLKLTFSGVGVGTSAMTITEAEFTNGTSGGKTTPALEHGSLTVAYDPSLLEQFALTGAVSLQGQVYRTGVPFTLLPGQTYAIGPYDATSTGLSSDNLDFGRVVADSYIVTTSQPRYLNLTEELGKGVTVSAGGTVMQALRLFAGNAVWSDNVIDAADASLVGACFGMTVADLLPGETLDADVNFDGIVDLKDLALVAGNYDLSSAAAYQDWQP